MSSFKSSLPTEHVGRDEKRAPVKTPAWEANSEGVSCDFLLYVVFGIKRRPWANSLVVAFFVHNSILSTTSLGQKA